MSYVRFGWDDSDVYVINTMLDHMPVIACVACMLEYKKSTFITVPGILAHLDKHRDAGHHVPESAYEGITARGNEWLTYGWKTGQGPGVDGEAGPAEG